MAAVSIGRNIGYIDTTGKTIIEPKWTAAGSFSDGLALVATGGNNIYYRTDTKLNIMSVSPLEPSQYAPATTYSTIMGRMYFIDKTGGIVIDLQNLEVKEGLLPGFSEGFAGVKIKDKWGFIDKTGKVVIEPKYDMVWPYFDGLSKVQIDDKYGYIDKTGKYIWEPTN